MRDATKLFVYFAAVLLLGAILAPWLFWGAQSLPQHGSFLPRYDFENVFHRALLLAAIALLWPLIRSLKIRSPRDLGLAPDPRAAIHVTMGWFIAVIPLACAAIVLIVLRIFLVKTILPWASLIGVVAAAVIVPLIEETFFRGLILGVLLRSMRALPAVIITSAFFAVLHFLKAPAAANEIVTWYSGFNSIARAFSAFRDPIFVLSAFTLLFVLGWILADARLRTRSLWLPIGLHSGWICVSGAVSKLTKRGPDLLPWLGPNMLVGLLPLGLALLTWTILICWLKYAHRENN